jgi:hypothetical protein
VGHSLQRAIITSRRRSWAAGKLHSRGTQRFSSRCEWAVLHRGEVQRERAEIMNLTDTQKWTYKPKTSTFIIGRGLYIYIPDMFFCCALFMYTGE